MFLRKTRLSLAVIMTKSCMINPVRLSLSHDAGVCRIGTREDTGNA